MDVPEHDEIIRNIARVRERIAHAAGRAGRAEDAVTLIAVTKTIPPERIQAAYEAGIRDFGENYVQEAMEKRRDSLLGWADARWHFIGHLQSNKARDVAGRFAVIHSVDSVSLARALGKRAQAAGGSIDILLEVKLDPSETKFGLAPQEIPTAIAHIEEIAGVTIRGLMGMPPYGSDPEDSRPYFRTLHTLFTQMSAQMQEILSMGMTADFEIAVEEGATHLRVGTAIFGKRR